MDAELLASVDRLPPWTEGLFSAPLTLAVTGKDGAVVWRPAGERGPARISDQFRADAQQYHQRYAASPHFEALFRQALDATGLQVVDAPLILDLGAGSGMNSVLPCFNIFPGARQVATDLSTELLSLLASRAAQTGLGDRLVCVEMDATQARTNARCFDLVTGAAILHHLERPIMGLLPAARALKPGGHAIFMEPFDGYGLMRLAYERILAEADLRQAPLEPAVARVLRAMVVDIAARSIRDPAQSASAELDDKWLFSREHLQIAGANAGFSTVRFVPHNDHDSLYRDIAVTQLRLSAGLDTLTLPAWALDILDGFDAAMPPAAKRALMLEGTVVFTKAG